MVFLSHLLSDMIDLMIDTFQVMSNILRYIKCFFLLPLRFPLTWFISASLEIFVSSPFLSTCAPTSSTSCDASQLLTFLLNSSFIVNSENGGDLLCFLFARKSFWKICQFSTVLVSACVGPFSCHMYHSIRNPPFYRYYLRVYHVV